MQTINSPWIWTDHDPDQMAQLGQFRLKFSQAKSASWTGYADTFYTLFCNGQVVGVGPALGHFSQPYLTTWDLTLFLQEGENVLAVEVWFDGRREDIADASPLQAGVSGLLVTDGKEFPTGPQWKARYAPGYQMPSTEAWRPYVSRRLIVADLREEPADWAMPGFDDSSWPAARVLAAHPERIQFRSSPILAMSRIEMPLRMVTNAGIARGGSEITLAEDVAKQMLAQTHESLIRPAATVPPIFDGLGKTTLHLPDGDALRKLGWKVGDEGFLSGAHRIAWPIAVPSVEGAFFLTCDFGRQLTGCIVLDLETTADSTMIDIGYAEALTEGRVDPCSQGHSIADRVTLGPGRRVVRLPHDRGFRYAQLSVFGACQIHHLHVEHHAYPIDGVKRFVCSDQALNAVWDGAVETLEQCALSTLTDNSRRERQGWGGPDLVVVNVAFFAAFGDTRLPGKKLADFCDIFDVYGKIPSWAPGFCNWFGTIPSHDLWFPSGCWDYLLISGDRDSAERLLHVSESVLQQYDLKKNADGLLADTGGWKWSEWTFHSVDGVDTWENLLAVQAWRDVAKMRRWLGRDGADTADARAEEISRSLVEKHWHPFHNALSQGVRSDGQLSDFCGQLDNAMAVKLDLLPAGKREATIRFCAGRSGTWPTNRSGWQGDAQGGRIRHEPRQPVVAGSPVASDLCVQTIFQIGQRELALNYIRFNFGAMIDEGEGTAWESWGHWTGDFAANCQCQSFGASVAATLVREVLGLSIVEPGGSVVVWKAISVPIDWAEGRVDTAHGPVIVRWDKEHLSWNVPSGVTLRIVGVTNQEIVGPAKSS